MLYCLARTDYELGSIERKMHWVGSITGTFKHEPENWVEYAVRTIKKRKYGEFKQVEAITVLERLGMMELGGGFKLPQVTSLGLQAIVESERQAQDWELLFITKDVV